ncbi:MAG: hypothetical protein ACMZ7B_06740 [Balneola sp.]
MKPEQQLFEEIRIELIENYPFVEAGNMMGSPAITQNRKVFAFLSKKFLMVFKLGKEFDPETQDFEIHPFNPFKKRDRWQAGLKYLTLTINTGNR